MHETSKVTAINVVLRRIAWSQVESRTLVCTNNAVNEVLMHAHKACIL